MPNCDAGVRSVDRGVCGCMRMNKISAIVFDLDGTLYESDIFAALIQDSGRDYMAGVLGLSVKETGELMNRTRIRLQEELGSVQTLSAVCTDLGGNIQDLHAYFSANLRPEAYLQRDQRVIGLLKALAAHYSLILFTNNNRALTMKIIAVLGFDNCFEKIYTIDDAWNAKPNEETLTQILAGIGAGADEVLFVGDRYDVDLRLPEARGCPVCLVRSVDQLLKLGASLLGER